MACLASAIAFVLALALALGAPATTQAQAVREPIAPAQAVAEIERTLDERLLRQGASVPPGLPARMAELRLPAVSIAVIHKGQVHWARAWGEARPGVSATTETRFSAGSISKPVGALGALRLAEARGISIDADLRPMLQRWQPAAEDGAPRYTLRRLLSHSASLSTHGFGGYAMDAPLPTLEQILDGLPPANSQAVRPLEPPVPGFKYSGGGSTIVQLWVEEQTGLPYAQAMQTWVLTPLGMTQSSFEQPPREALALHAFSHQGVGRPEPGGWRVYPEMPAAGLWSTPSDLARMLIAVQNARHNADAGSGAAAISVSGPDAANAGGLSATVAHTATRRETERTSPGFFLDGKRFGHNGSNQGFESAALINGDTGDGLVIMINSQNSWTLIDAVIRTVARVYGWPDMAAPRAAAEQRLPPGAAAWAGRYITSDGSAIQLRAAQGSLWLQPGPGAWERLWRTTDGRYTTERGQPVFTVSREGLRGSISEHGQPLDPSVLSPRQLLPGKLPQITVRGSLTNWQPGPVMRPVGGGRYLAEVELPAGKHEFKIGDDQWQRVNLGATQAGPLQAGVWTQLRWQGGNLLLDHAEAGRWRLELDAPDRPGVAARLRMTRLTG
jgi:CubicO group peptidase (beta-lactamase class C family)